MNALFISEYIYLVQWISFILINIRYAYTLYVLTLWLMRRACGWSVENWVKVVVFIYLKLSWHLLLQSTFQLWKCWVGICIGKWIIACKKGFLYVKRCTCSLEHHGSDQPQCWEVAYPELLKDGFSYLCSVYCVIKQGIQQTVVTYISTALTNDWI